MADSQNEERTLTEWSRRLTQALQILDLEVDTNEILRLAEKSSQSVSPSAGPLSTFMVGYAAGLAATSGKKSSDAAVRSALDVATQVAERGTDGRPESDGWTDTAQ